MEHDRGTLICQDLQEFLQALSTALRCRPGLKCALDCPPPALEDPSLSPSLPILPLPLPPTPWLLLRCSGRGPSGLAWVRGPRAQGGWSTWGQTHIRGYSTLHSPEHPRMVCSMFGVQLLEGEERGHPHASLELTEHLCSRQVFTGPLTLSGPNDRPTSIAKFAPHSSCQFISQRSSIHRSLFLSQNALLHCLS